MTTWIVGDIHGCAEELAELIGRLDLGEDGHLVACGDLFHRGPDPAGVMDLLTDCGASFVLGNHERAILRRVHLDPRRADGSDRPQLQEHVRAEDPRGTAHQVMQHRMGGKYDRNGCELERSQREREEIGRAHV